MDEELARGLLDEVATAEPPPTRVDIGLARSHGRRRLRWRRSGQAAAGLAAVAIVAVIGVVGPFRNGHAATGRKAAAAQSAVIPPRQFSPLIPYAAFGWLPRGDALLNGELVSTNEQFLTRQFALTLYAAGRCTLASPQPLKTSPPVVKLTSQQVVRQLRQHQHPDLDCSTGSTSSWQGHLAGVAPRIDGHLAFWTLARGDLVWEYARGSWAQLSLPSRRDAMRDGAKVARDIRYRVATRPSIRFPVQLTGLPSAWHVAWVDFAADAGVLGASQYDLTNAPQVPQITTAPATAQSKCSLPPGSSQARTIDGHRVTVLNVKAGPHNQAQQWVCAADADGLTVTIVTSGQHVSPDAVAIFTHHLRLLGPDPAGWTTQPLR